MIYDKPLWQIIQQEALSSLPETFSSRDAIEWLRAKYPKFRVRAITDHLRAMSVNEPVGRHSRSLPSDVLLKLGPSSYKRYDPESDGLFGEDGKPLDPGGDDSRVRGPDEDEMDDVGFPLEAHLEDFMDANWDRIDFGRKLRRFGDDQGRRARQFPTSVGVIDFLCQDETTGDLVVIELKKGRSSDKVLGQCQRYMGWVQENLAKQGQDVRGLIVAPEQDDRLRFALKVAPSVEMLCYRVDFQLVSPAESSTND